MAAIEISVANPTSWSGVDFTNAYPSDPTPLRSIYAALAERCAAACIQAPSWILNGLAGGAFFSPIHNILYQIRGTIIDLCKQSFVTIDYPRRNGFGWNYQLSNWSSFPVPLFPEHLPNHTTDGRTDPFGGAGHPMLLPAEWSPELNETGLTTYRTFLSDCAYWIDKMRYVDTTSVAKMMDSVEEPRTPYREHTTFSDAYSALRQDAGSQFGTNEIYCSLNVANSRDEEDGPTTILRTWRFGTPVYRLVAVNPSALRATAYLLVSMPKRGDYWNHHFDSRRITWDRGGTTSSATITHSDSSKHGSIWADEDVSTWIKSGHDITTTEKEYIWTEDGSESLCVRDDISHSQDSAELPDPPIPRHSSYMAVLLLFDSFGIGSAGMSNPIAIEAHDEHEIFDFTTGLSAPTERDSGGIQAYDWSYNYIFAFIPYVVMDYYNSFKFKLNI